MKPLYMLFMCAVPLLCMGSAHAADPAADNTNVDETGVGEFSASVSLHTEYVFRGISQTDNDFAVQGTADYSLPTNIEGIGLNLGLFASNIDFTPNTDVPDDGSVEIDVLAAITGEADGFGWSVGGIYYIYPDADSSLNQDYFEVTASVEYALGEAFTVGGNYAYSPDFFGGIGNAHWYEATASYGFSLVDGIPQTLDVGFGRQEFEAGGDYNTWRVGMSADVTDNVTLGVQYIDTNTDIIVGSTNISDDRVVGSLTFNF